MSRRRHAHLLSSCLVASALLLAPTLGSAQSAPKAPAGKPKSPAAAAATQKASFTEACNEGATKYAARDFPAAVQTFQKAIEAAPKNPLGHYYLGEAQLAAGNLTEAEAAWNRASLEAGGESDAGLKAKVLFVLADLKERQKKWDDARNAWQTYLDFAGKYPKVSYPGSGQSRQQVIDAAQKQELAYVVVRKRIAETKAGGVFTDLSKSVGGGPAPAPGAAPAPAGAPAAPPAPPPPAK